MFDFLKTQAMVTCSVTGEDAQLAVTFSEGDHKATYLRLCELLEDLPDGLDQIKTNTSSECCFIRWFFRASPMLQNPQRELQTLAERVVQYLRTVRRWNRLPMAAYIVSLESSVND